MIEDRDLVLRVVAELGRRIRRDPIEGLAHELDITRKLHASMQAATDVAPLRRPNGHRDLGISAMLADQRSFNRAVVESLHQLDQRSKAHDERIRAIEATDPTPS